MADNINTIEAEGLAEKAFDAGDPIAVNNARKTAGRKRSQRLRVIEALMQHEDGRRWIYELLDRCHIYGNPLIQGDPYSTHFNIGEANIGRIILADVVAAAPEQYVTMCTEGKSVK